MNQLTIIGNLTRSPESRVVGDKTVCNFDVAVNRDFKRDGQPDADFFRVAAWGKMGENCQTYLDKGRKVAVTGEVSCRAYEAKDGTHKAQMEIHANKVEFLTPKTEQAQNIPAEEPHEYADVNPDDIPF